MKRRIDKIIIHCSATCEGRAFAAADIDRWHRQQGMDMIGYHYVVLLDGTIQSGRPIERVGAHTAGHNAHSIGICYIGGLDADGKAKDTRTLQQRDVLWALVQALRKQYPHATVHGHREFANKDCPCFDVSREFGNGQRTTDNRRRTTDNGRRTMDNSQ